VEKEQRDEGSAQKSLENWKNSYAQERAAQLVVRGGSRKSSFLKEGERGIRGGIPYSKKKKKKLH